MDVDDEVAALGGSELQLDVTEPCSLEALTAALTAICDQAEARDGQTVVVVRLGVPGGERFWMGDARIDEVNRWERAVRRLERLTAVTIAAASGTCGGPTLDLLLAADYRIGTSDLRLLLPINDGQFWPGMSVYRLAHQVGAARARQLVLWGSDIAGGHAAAIGLIDEVADDVDGTISSAIALLGRVPDVEVAIRRQLLLEAGSASFEDALGVHLAACDRELRRGVAVPGGR